jgi:hypothetical protein
LIVERRKAAGGYVEQPDSFFAQLPEVAKKVVDYVHAGGGGG